MNVKRSKVELPSFDEIRNDRLVPEKDYILEKQKQTAFETQKKKPTFNVLDTSQRVENPRRCEDVTSGSRVATTTLELGLTSNHNPDSAPVSAAGSSKDDGSLTKSVSSNAIRVSRRQRGNPVLKYLRNVPWCHDETIIPDFVINETASALFLSLRYHRLNPEYIHERFRELSSPRKFRCQILLVQVDVTDSRHLLRELNRIAINANSTLMLAWSPDEVAKSLESYKIYENKPPEVLMPKTDHLDERGKLIEILSSIKSVNKTDAQTLIETFGSLRGICEATVDEIILCPGFGPLKAKRLYKVLHEPFSHLAQPQGDLGGE